MIGNIYPLLSSLKTRPANATYLLFPSSGIKNFIPTPIRSSVVPRNEYRSFKSPIT
jgi:hypothetical protein